jgi:hypothetical protein
MGTIRPVGSAMPTKRGRTPFTAMDDKILMNWVTLAEKKGLAIKGNAIYEQLEELVRLCHHASPYSV